MKIMKSILAATCALVTCSVFAGKSGNVEFLNSNPDNPYPFSEAVKVGDLVFLSGKIGTDPKTGKLATGGIEGESHQTLKNIKQSLNNHDLTMKDVVKCTVILTDIKEWPAFNEVYKQHFSKPYPARSAFAVSGLALNAKVEVECIAAAK
ncbi:RidA family protein [Thalassotalea euphylliae]|uniref:RidA family protein n=1 Tax=Thalassotalea euphylliae TaxID=1655234 RepID=UPI0036339354